ncbi:hypothetical protein CLF_107363 [Clonorchis sinensis]|uniref:Uncharacterized protein n=1 Tax=Clonorchis sinensis TaxID=79923 RepID=G7YGN1_CLOSI|nr:hypothetical protein CLF_107363 [Clonorchis sinensis]
MEVTDVNGTGCIKGKNESSLLDTFISFQRFRSLTELAKKCDGCRDIEYAGDIAIFSSDLSQMQAILNNRNSSVTWFGMRFTPAKLTKQLCSASRLFDIDWLHSQDEILIVNYQVSSVRKQLSKVNLRDLESEHEATGSACGSPAAHRCVSTISELIIKLRDEIDNHQTSSQNFPYVITFCYRIRSSVLFR